MVVLVLTVRDSTRFPIRASVSGVAPRFMEIITGSCCDHSCMKSVPSLTRLSRFCRLL